jgi:hypothetical protein
VLKTLDTFEFAAQPSLNEARVRELVRGEYIDGKENVLLVGNPGTGSHGTAIPGASCLTLGVAQKVGAGQQKKHSPTH